MTLLEIPAQRFRQLIVSALISSVALVSASRLHAQPLPVGGETLEQQLVKEDPSALAQAARAQGDATRGAILFYQPLMTCTKCHGTGHQTNPLGPDLTKPTPDVTDVYLVESVLQPSKKIKTGYEPVIVITDDGKSLTALLAEDRPDELILRDPAQDGKLLTIPKDSIEEQVPGQTSVMPAGLVNGLTNREQFLDLVRYLFEITEHGPQRARQLEPLPHLYALPPIPEYEKDIDHAGMIADLNADAFRRGEAIYNNLCINCHGTKDQPGSLPTSLKFASGPFKNGGDPFSMYQTLTKGYGLMMPQPWMVPQQKYDVIHYIREAYLKPHNPTQFKSVEPTYLAQLPKGTSRGPKPSIIEPWVTMDYGPFLTATYEVGHDETNYAYKGIAIRLDPGPGGVSRGRHWMLYDHDTLRVAAAWRSGEPESEAAPGQSFIDWDGILFNGRHAVHPHVVGQVQLANPTGPGWANPENSSFDDIRLRGRDNRPYGPLPRSWAHYKGLHQFGNQVLVAYTVGSTDVLEMPSVDLRQPTPVYTRTFQIGPRRSELVLQVARDPRGVGSPVGEQQAAVVLFGQGHEAGKQADTSPLAFNGAASIEPARPDDFDLAHRDYTISARISTRLGGSIFCKTAPTDRWVPDGKSLFIRGGRLVFDIGWVGAVHSRHAVDDGQWHDVAMTYEHATGHVRLFIDGRLDGEGKLKPRGDVQGHVVRIGYTSPNFPEQQTYFDGHIIHVRFYRRAVPPDEIAALDASATSTKDLLADWRFEGVRGDLVPDATGNGHDGKVVHGASASTRPSLIVAGASGLPQPPVWQITADGSLRLRIPAGTEPLAFTLWFAAVETAAEAESVTAAWTAQTGEAPVLSTQYPVPGTPAAESQSPNAVPRPLNPRPPDPEPRTPNPGPRTLNPEPRTLTPPPRTLTAFTHGGPSRWPDRLTTQATMGAEDGPFAVDVLTHPSRNPWLCQTRFTGFDFFADGRRAAICSWDGDVWIVSGVDRPEDGLTWQRIASGLFQPLGLKIIDDRVYVGCRDQIVILRDLNGDGETDFYENFNNDHQVTDHFHEFAMGLQTDAAGSFYYAKGARHALPALVPQHGTLVRVSPDGTRTDILATGFRAPNGVCVNPDGTWFVTDQEGHWTPKNRINLITPNGGFFGNFWGYHDVTDPADDKMKQPLCWITNAMDRSPAELLWVDSDAWGPLKGSLLNTSYGYGMLYIVPHETVGGEMQGGVCPFPLKPFPTGIMRARFHPQNGQLYTCGMYAWAGNQQEPGGFYRVRYTGKPVHLPVGLHARQDGMAITFSGPLDRETATNPVNYGVQTWTIRRSANYGSDHYDQRTLPTKRATLSEDGKTVFLEIPDIQPTWCMEIKYWLKGTGGETASGTIHNTIHRLGVSL